MYGASSAIRTDALSRSFGAVRALDSVTIEVRAGSVFGLLGPNGAGKTTFIRLLLGLLEPTSGHAEVLGYNTREDAGAIREASGVLLEHAGLYERLTAEQNLDLFARFWRMPPKERLARTRELLLAIGLWDRRRDIVGGWSRGMKQKLAIARAMLHRPRLLFLDEPTAGLDPVAARALRADLVQLASAGGVTVFLTTHNLAEVEQICSQVALIKAGTVVAEGTPAGLRGMRASLEDAFVEMMESPS